MSKFVSIVTVTYVNSAEVIASQSLAETMMEKIALDNGCERVRCYQSGDYIRIIIFEYNEETIQTKVINSLKVGCGYLVLLLKNCYGWMNDWHSPTQITTVFRLISLSMELVHPDRHQKLNQIPKA